MIKQLPFILFLLIVCTTLNAQSEEVLIRADKMPYFPGCAHLDVDSETKRQCSNLEVVNFLSSNLEYPDTAKTYAIEGAVIVSFIIDENGIVTDPYLIRDIGGGCGAEALRVINMMPKWEAGMHDNKKVKIKLNLPIQFKLKDELEIASKYKIIWGDLEKETATKNELRGNIPNDIIILNESGEEVKMNNLTFSFEKKKKYLEEGSSGAITKEMRKVVRKVRKDGVFTLTITIQDDGELIDLERQFTVVN